MTPYLTQPLLDTISTGSHIFFPIADSRPKSVPHLLIKGENITGEISLEDQSHTVKCSYVLICSACYYLVQQVMVKRVFIFLSFIAKIKFELYFRSVTVIVLSQIYQSILFWLFVFVSFYLLYIDFNSYPHSVFFLF